MQDQEEVEIVRLLRQSSRKERNKGALLFENRYRNKVLIWVSNQKVKVEAEDVWQEAVILMVLAIQKGTYQLNEDAQMYTYFYPIIRSAYGKEIKKKYPEINIDFIGDTIPQEHKDFEPDTYTEMKQYQGFLKECYEKFDNQTRALFKAIYGEGRKLKDVYESLNLKNYNNAKQKMFSSKKKLVACLKRYLGDGK